MLGKLQIFSGSAHPQLAQEICKYLDTPLGKTQVTRFSNDNLMVQIQDNVRGNDVFVVQTSCSPVSDGIIELFIMLDALRSASAGRITAVIPYFPYVRSDKKDKPRISITARLMADLLKTSGADRVLTMDLHSPQIQGFFSMPVDQLSAQPALCAALEKRNLENVVLVAGDVGEAKEVGSFARRLKLPVAIIDKRRLDDSEKPVAVHLVGEVDGKHAVIVDDEIASGGTLIEASAFLLKHGAKKVSAVATHPIFTGNASERILNSGLEEVIVTNTVPFPKEKQCEKVTILSVAPLFAEAIRRIHHSESVGAMLL